MKINKTAFYILSFTWGLPLTLIGCLVAGVLLCLGHRPKKTGYGYCFEVGQDWGGLELGFFFITEKDSSWALKVHEFGHGVQNCVYGFLMIPLITIPSAIRYWYREAVWRRSKEKYYQLPEYNAIWFERQATDWGYRNVW